MKSSVSCASSVAALFAAALLVTALPSDGRADGFDKALAEIDKALETNPMGVSKESLKSCRSMRDTAVLLRDIGQVARAVRRLKSCRRLLGLEGYRSGMSKQPAIEWG